MRGLETEEQGQARQEGTQVRLIRRRIDARSAAVLVALTALVMLSASDAGAVTSSERLHFERQFGAGVLDGASQAEVCEVITSCQPGVVSAVPGGLAAPGSVAVAPSGDIYVSDALGIYPNLSNNNRVDEFTPAGQFVLMFGWEVNKTKAKAGAPQSERDVCTAAEVSGGAECGAASERGTGLPAQFDLPQAVTVDPVTGNVFVSELESFRIEEFTETGQFVLMVGREVNETLSKQAGASPEERNVCTAAQVETEGMKCQAGKPKATIGERDAFDPKQEYGNILAVGGPNDLLYVADEGRVAELGASGKWEGQISVGETSTPAFPADGWVTAVAVDGVGDVYLTESNAANTLEAPRGVFEFNPAGDVIAEFDKSSGFVEALALDPFGRMAVINTTQTIKSIDGGGVTTNRVGEFIELSKDKVLSRFVPPNGFAEYTRGLAFDASGELFSADAFHNDVEAFDPVPVAQVEALACRNRTGSELTFQGTVNPDNLEDTHAWFQYGASTQLGSSTPKQSFAQSALAEPIEATIAGLTPNVTYYYQVSSEDVNDRAPEEATSSETTTCKTRALPPVIPGAGEAQPSGASFTAATLSAKIDPENAPTAYRFQYVPAAACEALEATRKAEVEAGATGVGPVPVGDLAECPGVVQASASESAEYRLLTAQQTIRGLQPATAYRYQLVGDNSLTYQSEEEGGRTLGQVGEFTTIPAPSMSATTLAAGGVGTTGATIAGLVDSDGFEATYAFEVGVEEGAATQYGLVLSAPTGNGVGPREEALTLDDLQPGTTYAYRIAVRSGYGTVYGASETFTTGGLPDVLVQSAVLAQLPVPSIAFPAEGPKVAVKAVKCKRGYARSKQNRCIKLKSKKKRAKKAHKAGRARNAKKRGR